MPSVRLALACVAALAAFALPARADVDKPVRLLVGFAPGGSADIAARLIADRIKDDLRQPVVVENRPGAGGNVAADAVAKSPPDGYTILQNTNGQAISPAIYRTLPFDTLKDFIPVIVQPAVAGLSEPQRLHQAVTQASRPGTLDDDFSLLVVTFT